MVMAVDWRSQDKVGLSTPRAQSLAGVGVSTPRAQSKVSLATPRTPCTSADVRPQGNFHELNALVEDFVRGYNRLLQPDATSTSLRDACTLRQPVCTPRQQSCSPRQHFQQLEGEFQQLEEELQPKHNVDFEKDEYHVVFEKDGSGELLRLSVGSHASSHSSQCFKHPRLSDTLSDAALSERELFSKTRTMKKLISDAEDQRFDVPRASRSAPATTRQTKRCIRSLIRFGRWCIDTPRDELTMAVLEPVMGFFIVLNVILTGISFDTDDWDGWFAIDCFFAGLYTIEILIRLKMLGWREFYFGDGCGWSVFDTAIVVLAFVDIMFSITGSVTVVRVLRLARMPRLIRLMRLPILRELNMLFRGMLGGSRCLLWCMMFLTLPVFIIGMILSQILHDWEEDGLFSSVPAAMFTTLRCMCGDCTDPYGRPLLWLVARSRGWYFALFYSLFIMVTLFGVFNLITAIFVEGTMQAAKSDASLQHQFRKAGDKRFAKNIKTLVFWLWAEHCDMKGVSSCGTTAVGRTTRMSARVDTFKLEDALDLQLDQDSYQMFVRKPHIREVLVDMGLHDDDLAELFDMLDVDRSGTLDINELVLGLHKLRGDPSKRDLVSLAYMIYGIQDSVQELHTALTSLRETQGWQVAAPTPSGVHQQAYDVGSALAGA